MAKKRDWHCAVDIRIVDYDTVHRYNPVRHASSMLFGGLFLGAYGVVRAHEKHRGENVGMVTIQATFPDGYVDTVTTRYNGAMHKYALGLMDQLEAKNNTN